MSKKFLIVLVLILAISTTMIGCGNEVKEDTSLKDIKDKGHFVVGLDDSFPPMGFRNSEGDIVGFDIDLAKAAAEKMGVEVKFKPVEWDGVILSLKNKDIDVIWNGLTITEERQEKISFTKPYIANKQAIVVNGKSETKSKKDLEDKIVGLQLGSSSEEALSNNSEFKDSLKEVRKYSNNVEALLDLKAERIDAVVMDEIVARYYITDKKEDYKVLDEYLAKENYGVGVRKEDKKFLKELEKALDEMKEDGTAKEISNKWFSEDIITR
ncbi:MAG: amino acid ABC transporter substrate-binding protein [Firmicutes bacterium]|nr:amino acid ABC transporter substrate-binding protein [Bacillota bacterium]